MEQKRTWSFAPWDQAWNFFELGVAMDFHKWMNPPIDPNKSVFEKTVDYEREKKYYKLVADRKEKRAII